MDSNFRYPEGVPLPEHCITMTKTIQTLFLPAQTVQVGEIPAQIRVTGAYLKSIGLSSEDEIGRELTGQDMSLYWFRDTPRVRELLKLQGGRGGSIEAG